MNLIFKTTLPSMLIALYKDMMVHMGDMQNIVRELAV